MDYRLKKHWQTLSEYYGFVPVCLPGVEDARLVAAALKAKLMDRQAVVQARTASGRELVLFPPPLFSVIRLQVSGQFEALPYPVKVSVAQPKLSTPSLPASTEGSDGKGDGFAVEEQWGLVILGEEGPVAEAEIVQVIWQTVREWRQQSEGLMLRVNAITCETCRSLFRTPLTSYLRSRVNRLCRSCKRQLKAVPTRVLSCPEEKCSQVAEQAPSVLDFLCEMCKKHLKGFLEFLDEMSVPYFLDSRLFREGTFYQTLLFELVMDGKKPEGSGGEGSSSRASFAQATVLADGGRASRAAELSSGKRLAAVSGTLYPEVVSRLSAPPTAGTGSALPGPPAVFLAQLGELAKRKSFALIEQLRSQGVEVHQSLGRDAVKVQLKLAERLGVPIALILGQKEVLDGTVIVREMESGIQETIPQNRLIEFLKRKLKR